MQRVTISGRRFYPLRVLGSFILLIFAAPSYGQPAPVLWEANGHYYEVRNDETCPTWSEARDLAVGSTYMGLQGHLATIASSEENAFLVPLRGSCSGGDAWIGGYQPADTPDNEEPAGNWQWVTNEPFAYTNWDTTQTEPSDFQGNEDCLEMEADGQWNDNNCSPTPGDEINEVCCYLVEYEPVFGEAAPVPTMNQWGLIVFGILLAVSAVRFIRRRREHV